MPAHPVTQSADSQRRLIVISGLSGAGKSVALNTLEDLDFYSIDNLPISLLDPLINSLDDLHHDFPRQLAVGIDARNPETDFSLLIERLSSLKAEDISAEIIFIEASAEVLTKRFSETRRKHPLSSEQLSLSDAIDKERKILAALSDAADLHIDTSFTAVHELRKLVLERVARRSHRILSLQFISFGYKHGIPRDADFVFDIRCLPNPHWEKNLRKYSGKDQPVIQFLTQQPDVLDMRDQITRFLEDWIPRFEEENRSYLSIAIGCTGGHHRSVFMVEQLADYFQRQDRHLIIRHRDL